MDAISLLLGNPHPELIPGLPSHPSDGSASTPSTSSLTGDGNSPLNDVMPDLKASDMDSLNNILLSIGRSYESNAQAHGFDGLDSLDHGSREEHSPSSHSQSSPPTISSLYPNFDGLPNLLNGQRGLPFPYGHHGGDIKLSRPLAGPSIATLDPYLSSQDGRKIATLGEARPEDNDKMEVELPPIVSAGEKEGKGTRLPSLKDWYKENGTGERFEKELYPSLSSPTSAILSRPSTAASPSPSAELSKKVDSMDLDHVDSPPTPATTASGTGKKHTHEEIEEGSEMEVEEEGLERKRLKVKEAQEEEERKKKLEVVTMLIVKLNEAWRAELERRRKEEERKLKEGRKEVKIEDVESVSVRIP
ncbi:hypothetical protein BT69DRAFT_1286041, partial [Atractiella rhizophila]